MRAAERAVLQAPTAPEVPARAFRVVCDSMLQGLARRLRGLGADVLTLRASEDHRRVSEVSGGPAGFHTPAEGLYWGQGWRAGCAAAQGPLHGPPTPGPRA